MKKSNKYMYIGMTIGLCVGCNVGILLKLGFFPNALFIGVIGMVIGMLIGDEQDKKQNR